jgi:phospho-N-acetylmuramoyl-pentapeptide-transferase
VIPWILSRISEGAVLSPVARALAAALTALLLTLALGPPFIEGLRRRGLRERPDKSDSPALVSLWSRTDKRSTPTMGGILLVGAFLAATVAWVRPVASEAWLAPLAVLGFAAVGAVDDRVKLAHAARSGLTRRQKMAALSAVAVLLLLAYLTFAASAGRNAPLTLHFPFHFFDIEESTADLSSLGLLGTVVFLGVGWFVLVGAANSVNISDGMDGLAAGLSLFVSLSLAALAAAAGHPDSSARFGLAYVPNGSETAVAAAALSGATLGFLWFNCHPAQVFLGDTGALALGGGLGALAIAAKQELVLPLVAAVLVAEAASSWVQIAWFRRTGRRLLPIAPLHHIPQLRGAAEPRVVLGFWLAGAGCALGGVALVGIR